MDHGRADGFDGSDNFVPGNEGVLGHLPIVLHHAQIAVADSAGADFDVHLGGRKVTEFVLKFFQWATWFGEGVCGDGCHVRKGAYIF